MTKGKNLKTIYQQIRDILTQARARAYHAANDAMVKAYWNIGRVIVDEEQHGEQRAEYGKRLIQDLSRKLTGEFGQGFDKRNRWFMCSYSLAYPKMNALRSEIAWIHSRVRACQGTGTADHRDEEEDVGGR